MDWIISTVGGLVGAVIAIFFVMFVEHLRKPRLSLEIGNAEDTNWTGRPANKARWLRLKAENKQLPWWAKWLSRNTALHCSGLITFHHLDRDGQNIFGRPMQARWVSTREPLPIRVVAEGREPMYIIDPVRLTPEIHRDIYSGQSEQLDVAGRFDNDVECYGWCDENYLSEPQWRNLDWKLGKGQYVVKVTVRSSGTKCSDVFRLINDGLVDTFRLEKAQPSDYKTHKHGLREKG